MNAVLDVKAIMAMPYDLALQELDKAERKFIEREIQPWVARRFLAKNEQIESFSIEGAGTDKRIRWEAAEGCECEGCYGSGYITSGKGTRTECPDCDSSGMDWDGDSRTLVTDYDGDEILEGESRAGEGYP